MTRGSAVTPNSSLPNDSPADDVVVSVPGLPAGRKDRAHGWYDACDKVAGELGEKVPPCYRNRTFSGIIGDIKALSPKKAASLIGRKKGLGTRYAELYLSQGIDHGRGYQACASEALASALGDGLTDVVRGRILDAGCAVGVTAGVLGLYRVTGFDLFPDLLRAGRMADRLAGRVNHYAAADMTRPWPFRDSSFDTIICALVCHHLKDNRDIFTFFKSASDTLASGGRLIVTLPAGSISNAERLETIAGAIEERGFRRIPEYCGMSVSTDDPRSLFWMFLLVFEKTSPFQGGVFVHEKFGFPEFRTPETRVEKGEKVRSSATKERLARHGSFRFFTIGELLGGGERRTLVYKTVRAIPEEGLSPNMNSKGKSRAIN